MRCCPATLLGNTADKTTLRGFLDHIERQYSKARRVWLMDRGVPTEEVLAEMRAADPPVHYLVGTPKGRLTRLEEASDRSAVAAGATRRASQALGARRRALRSGAKPRPRRQGAGNAAAPVEAVVGAAQAAVDDAADA